MPIENLFKYPRWGSRTVPRRAAPRWTVSRVAVTRTDNSLNGRFQDEQSPGDISLIDNSLMGSFPIGQFPERTFPQITFYNIFMVQCKIAIS